VILSQKWGRRTVKNPNNGRIYEKYLSQVLSYALTNKAMACYIENSLMFKKKGR